MSNTCSLLDALMGFSIFFKDTVAVAFDVQTIWWVGLAFTGINVALPVVYTGHLTMDNDFFIWVCQLLFCCYLDYPDLKKKNKS